MNQRGQSLTIDLGWHQSDEGLSALAHLRDPISGNPKRIFGNPIILRHIALHLSVFSLTRSFRKTKCSAVIYANFSQTRSNRQEWGRKNCPRLLANKSERLGNLFKHPL